MHDARGLAAYVVGGASAKLSQRSLRLYAKRTRPRVFKVMYGNQPDRWSDNLTGMDRLRVIVNYLTRMRFVGVDNELDLLSKEGTGTAPEGFVPWFELPERARHQAAVWPLGGAGRRDR